MVPLGYGLREWVLMLPLALLACGCSPRDPLETRVNAADVLGFDMWQSDIRERLGPAQRNDLAQALQEIRFHVMAGGASGSAAVEDGLIARIDGKSVREVLALELGWRLERALKEQADLKAAIPYNSQAVHRRKGVESLDMASRVERQVERLEAADEEVARVRSRMAVDGLPPSQQTEAGH